MKNMAHKASAPYSRLSLFASTGQRFSVQARKKCKHWNPSMCTTTWSGIFLGIKNESIQPEELPVPDSIIGKVPYNRLYTGKIIGNGTDYRKSRGIRDISYELLLLP